MSSIASEATVDARPDRQPVAWLTVLFLATGMALADGFVVTSLEQAVGPVAGARGAYLTWLGMSGLLLPALVLAVLWAVRSAHRRYGGPLTTARSVVVASLLVVVAATAVGVAAVVVSSVHNYGLQAQELRLTEATHFHPASSGHVEEPGACSGSCEALRSTLAVHVRGTGYAGGVLLGTNLLLVAWVVALRGGELEPSRGRRSARP